MRYASASGGAGGSVPSSTALVLGNRIVGLLAWGLLLWLSARAMGPARYGPLAAWMSAIVVAQVLLDFGMSSYSVRELAKDPTWGGYRVLSRWRLNAAVVLVVLAVTVWTQGGHRFDIAVSSIGYFIGYLAGHCVADLAVSPALAAGRQGVVAGWQAAERVAALLIYAMTATALGAARAVPLAMFAAAVVYAVGSVGLGPHPWRSPPATPRPRELLRRSSTFALISFASQVQNLDVAVVAVAAGAVQAGFYSIPARLTNPMILIVSSYCTVLLPRLARHPGRAALDRARTAILVFALPAAVVCALVVAFLPWVIGGLLGTRYSSSVGPSRLILVAMMFLTVNLPLATLLQAFGREASVAGAIGATTLVGLPLTYVGARVGGATGAAGGWLAVQVTAFVLLGMSAMRLRRALVFDSAQK